MTNKYIMAIDAKIAELKKRLYDLEGMRRFMLAIDKAGAPAPVRSSASMHVKKSPPQPRKGLRDMIIAYMEDNPGPTPSRTLIDYTGMKDHRVWTMLSDMKKEGVLNYDIDTRTYTLNREPDDEAASS